MQNLRLSITLTMAIALFVSSKTAALPSSVYDDATARLVARAYVLSIPLLFKENDLIPLMAENKAYFVEDGKAIRCMRALGNALIQHALAVGQQTGGRSATEIFGGSMPEGLEDLPGQVDASMRSYSNDTFTMGQELLWLSQVLPSAAEGDYELYNTTGTSARQMWAQVLPYMRMLCQMNPDLCQTMQNVMREMQPVMEEQIYNLARQFSD